MSCFLIMKILNKKEIKKIIEELKDYYGVNELNLDYTFLKNNDDKIHIFNFIVEERSVFYSDMSVISMIAGIIVAILGVVV